MRASALAGFILLLTLLLGATGAAAAPTTLVPYQATGYRYLEVPPGQEPSGWETSSFDESSFGTGDAAFGSRGGCPLQATVKTSWDVATDMLLRKTITLPPGASGVTIAVTVDNDVKVYWNGTLVGAATHDGCSDYNDWYFGVPDNLLASGSNLLAVQGIDRGGESFLDVRVSLENGGAPLSITTSSDLPEATVGQPKQTTLAATGGTPPYTWAVNAIPPGGSANYLPTAGNGQPLSFDPTTGTISGTPAYAGSSTFTATVTDSGHPAQTASRTFSLFVEPSVSPQSATLCLNGFCPPSDTVNSGSTNHPPGGVVTDPHVAFVLVGSPMTGGKQWWCSLFGSKPISGSGCAPSTASATEPSAILGALTSLIDTDYADGTTGGYDLPLSQYYSVTGCHGAFFCGSTPVGRGVQIRTYTPYGTVFAGPLSPREFSSNGKVSNTKLRSALNRLTGGFGIHSQADVDHTVFVLLRAPQELPLRVPQEGPRPCLASGHTRNYNSQTDAGTRRMYGSFVFADIYLEGAGYSCAADINDNGHPTSTKLTPEQFATYVTSHELDEAITDPGHLTGGWLVPRPNAPGNADQVADPCALRTDAGRTSLTGQIFNFTRDRQGTVVAAYVDPNSKQCYPEVDTGIPPG